jgi:hypothetical protein
MRRRQSLSKSSTRGLAPITYEKYLEAAARVDRAFPLPNPMWEAVSDMQAPVARKIMALPATTLAGLAVKARVAQSACERFWDVSDADCDWDQLMARQLIEAVLAAGGVS